MYKTEIVESSEAVKTVFIELGESKIELLGSNRTNSSIAKFFEKNREGFHHLALDVEDIEGEITRLTNQGFTLIHSKAKAELIIKK